MSFSVGWDWKPTSYSYTACGGKQELSMGFFSPFLEWSKIVHDTIMNLLTAMDSVTEATHETHD